MEVLDKEAGADFVPLRLIIQPEGFCLDLKRPQVVIGRHSDADVRFAFPDISRRHCRCAFTHGRWQVVDLDSLNGIYVNDERIHEAYLYDGDRLRIGNLEMLVSLEDQHGVVSMPTRSSAAEVLHSIAEVLPAASERKAS